MTCPRCNALAALAHEAAPLSVWQGTQILQKQAGRNALTDTEGVPVARLGRDSLCHPASNCY